MQTVWAVLAFGPLVGGWYLMHRYVRRVHRERQVVFEAVQRSRAQIELLVGGMNGVMAASGRASRAMRGLGEVLARADGRR